MDDESPGSIFEELSRVYDERAQVARLAAELGNLVYEVGKLLEGSQWPHRLDYGLLGAIVSVELCLDQIRHNVLSVTDKVKMDQIRRARMVRLRQHTKPPIVI